ncbi:Fic family protein, partial [Hoyosella sp. YIM 151337]|uniref:Fic/DOC family protein n=1 Tax=Hoyosella sp. YIM 151337 TaxID=2992742 RepID=UPI002235CAA8
MTSSNQDPYIDPASGILRNKLRAVTREELKTWEAGAVAWRALQLDEQPITGRYDFAHLKAIHHHLFQDVYDWAGQTRTVNISKGEWFFPHHRIDMGAANIFAELVRQNYLKGLEPDLFIRRLAATFDQINHLHPFREGNGR